MDTKREKIYPPITRMDAKCLWSAAIPRLRDRFESADVSAHPKFSFVRDNLRDSRATSSSIRVHSWLE
jgi:hypothetical protein